MKKRFTKHLAVLLAILMVISILPFSAFASAPESTEPTSQEPSAPVGTSDAPVSPPATPTVETPTGPPAATPEPPSTPVEPDPVDPPKSEIPAVTEYTVEFVLLDTSIVKTTYTAADAQFPAPPVDGFVWTDAADAEKVYDKAVEGGWPTTVEGKSWKLLATEKPAADETSNTSFSEEVTVTFVAGDKVVAAPSGEAGATYEVPTAPVVEGSTFTCWTLNGAPYYDGLGVFPAASIELEALYTQGGTEEMVVFSNMLATDFVTVPVTIYGVFDEPKETEIAGGDIAANVAALMLAEGISDDEYEFDYALVDGSYVGFVGKLGEMVYYAPNAGDNSATKLEGDDEIELYFAKTEKAYDVEYVVMPAGYGTVEGPDEIKEGEEISFDITPAEAYYTVESVVATSTEARKEIGKLDSENSNLWQLSNVEENVTVTVTFKKVESYKVTVRNDLSEKNADNRVKQAEYRVGAGADAAVVTDNTVYDGLEPGSSDTTLYLRTILPSDRNSNDGSGVDTGMDKGIWCDWHLDNLTVEVDGQKIGLNLPAVYTLNASASTSLPNGSTITVKLTAVEDFTNRERTGWNGWNPTYSDVVRGKVFVYTITIAKLSEDITFLTGNCKSSERGEIMAMQLDPQISYRDSGGAKKINDIFVLGTDWTSKEFWVKFNDGYEGYSYDIYVTEGGKTTKLEAVANNTYNNRSGGYYTHKVTITKSADVPGKNVKLFMKAVRTSYGATFDDMPSGDVSKLYPGGTFWTPVLTPTPEEGYAFDGWKLVGEAGNTLYKPGTLFRVNDVLDYKDAENNIKFEAKYKELKDVEYGGSYPYMVHYRFETEGGWEIKAEYPDGEVKLNGYLGRTAVPTPALIATMTDENYTYDASKSDSEGILVQSEEDNEDGGLSVMTLSYSLKKYTVKWVAQDANGTVDAKTKTVKRSDPIPAAPANPAEYTKDGTVYTFKEWTLTKGDDSTGKVYGDITYTATYTSRPAKVSVTWLAKQADGTDFDPNYDQKEYDYGATAPTGPDKGDPPMYIVGDLAYEFDKWVLVGDNAPDENGKLVEDLIYEAAYKAGVPATVTITWRAHGDSDTAPFDRTTVAFNAQFPGHTTKVPATYTENGVEYTFNGTWTLLEGEIDSSGRVREALIYEANYDELAFSIVTFAVDPDSVDRGEITPATAPLTFKVYEGDKLSDAKGWADDLFAAAAKASGNEEVDYRFDRWQGEDTQAWADAANTSIGTFEPTGDVTIYAYFGAFDQVKVTFTAGANGSLVGGNTDTGWFDAGIVWGDGIGEKAITVPTTSDSVERYKFSHWILNGDETNEIADPATYKGAVNESLHFVAVFVEDANVELIFKVTGGGNFKDGTEGGSKDDIGPKKFYVGDAFEWPAHAADSDYYWFTGWFVSGGTDRLDVGPGSSGLGVPSTSTTYEARYEAKTPITIKGGSQSFAFTGKTFTSADLDELYVISAADLAELGTDTIADGVVVSGAATYKTDNDTDAAKTNITRSSVIIMRGTENVTDQYKITLAAGALSITNYDPGTENSALVYSVEGGEEFFKGEAFDVSKNGALYADGVLHTLPGGLTITTHQPATFTGRDVVRNDDGTAAGQDMAWAHENGIIITDSNGVDVTEHFEDIISYEKGEFTVKPVDITLTAQSGSVLHGKDLPELKFTFNGTDLKGDDEAADEDGKYAALNALFADKMGEGFAWLECLGYDPDAAYDADNNTFGITFTEAAKALTHDNYNLVLNDASNITENPPAITVTESFQVFYHDTLNTGGELPEDSNLYEDGNEPELLVSPVPAPVNGMEVVGWTDRETVYPLTAGKTLTIDGANIDLYTVWDFAASTTFALEGFKETYDGAYHYPTLTGSLLAGDEVTLYAGGVEIGSMTVAENTSTLLLDGIDGFKNVVDSDIRATVTRNDITKTTNEDQKATILARTLNITIEGLTKDYDGTPLALPTDQNAFTYDKAELAAGQDLTADSIAAINAALQAKGITYVHENGTANATLTFNESLVTIASSNEPTTGNYDVVLTEGAVLKIDPVTITVTAEDLNETYNGKAQSQKQFYASREGAYTPVYSDDEGSAINIGALGFADTHTLTAATAGSITNVNDRNTTNTLTMGGIMHGDVDVYRSNGDTASIKVVAKNGTLSLETIKLVLQSSSKTVTYDGTRQRIADSAEDIQITSGALVDGHAMDRVRAETSGLLALLSHINVGEYDNEIKFTLGSKPRIREGSRDVTANYEFEYVYGKLTIEQRTVVVFVEPEVQTYQGERIEVTKEYQAVPNYLAYYDMIKEVIGENELLEAIGSVADFFGLKDTGIAPADELLGLGGLYGDATASGLHIGLYGFERNSLGVKNAIGIDKTQNYKFIEIPSFMLIKRAEITVVSYDDEKVYDGRPLRNPNFKVYQDGVLIHDSGDANGPKFSDTFPDHKVIAPVVGTRTEVGSSDNRFSSILPTYISRDGWPTARLNFKVNREEGTLTVKPKELSIDVKLDGVIGGGETKEYDGTPLRLGDSKALSVSVSGHRGVSLANEQALIDLLRTDSITYVHESPAAVPTAETEAAMQAAVQLKGGKVSNFTFKVTPSTLTITPAPITIVSHDAGKVYDGTALTEGGYTVYYGNYASLDDIPADAALYTSKIAEHSFDLTFTGTATNVLESGDNTFTLGDIKHVGGIADAVNTSFEATSLYGGLTVNQRPVVVRANSSYGNVADGTRHRVAGYRVDPGGANSGLLTGHEFRNLAAGTSHTDVGNWTARFSVNGELMIVDKDNLDLGNLLSNYDVDLRTGTLEIVAPGTGPIIVPTEEDPDPPFVPFVDDGGDDEDDPLPPIELEDLPPPENPTTDIDPVDLDSDELPMADLGAWALLNLIIAVLTLVFAVLLLVTAFKRNKKKGETEEEQQARMAAQAANGEEPDETERNKKSGMLWRVLSILAGIAAPIVFFLTENIRLPMQFTDRWTLLMVIILVVQVIGMLLMKRARNQETDEDEEQTTEA